MHHIYHTEGIILGSRNYGEAGKYFFIFTRDLGMIRDSASGVRKLSSKLRFILQDFSYAKIDLVRGKDFWRVTSASKAGILEELQKNANAFKIFANISRLLKRLLPDEEANTTLFNNVISGFLILEKTQNKEELQNLEAVIVLRALHNLGYIGEGENIASLVESPFEAGVLLEMAKHRKAVLTKINQALKETHL